MRVCGGGVSAMIAVCGGALDGGGDSFGVKARCVCFGGLCSYAGFIAFHMKVVEVVSWGWGWGYDANEVYERH